MRCTTRCWSPSAGPTGSRIRRGCGYGCSRSCATSACGAASRAARRGGAGTHSRRVGVVAEPADALREVFDLVHRHLFEDSELALVLGVTPRRARSMRARAEVACAGLGMAFVPHRASLRPDPPEELRKRVLASMAVPGRVAYRTEVAAPRRRSGFPVPLDSVVLYRRVRAARIGAVVALPLALAVAVAVLPSAAPNVGVLDLSAPVASAPAEPSASRSAEPSPTSSPRIAPTPSPAVSAKAVAPPRPTAGTGAGAPRSSQRPAAPRRSSAPVAPRPAPSVSRPAPAPAPKPAPVPRPAPAPRPQPKPLVARLVGLAGKCVDVRFSGRAQGTAVDLFSCNGTDAQRWTMPADGTLRALGNCADLQAGGGAAGTRVVMRKCSGAASQRWSRTGGRLVNARARLCLDVPGFRTANFTQLIVWTCNGQLNQQWRVQR